TTVKSSPFLSAKATASSSVSKRSRTWFSVSRALDQPISGSGWRGVAGSYSSTHLRVSAVPDCMAVFAGRKMRARAIAVVDPLPLPPEAGRGERIRTSGFELPKLALYQAELRPDAAC